MHTYSFDKAFTILEDMLCACERREMYKVVTHGKEWAEVDRINPQAVPCTHPVLLHPN